MFTYLASLHVEPFWYNTNEYIHGHYLTLMTCTKWSQPDLHSPNSDCW